MFARSKFKPKLGGVREKPKDEKIKEQKADDETLLKPEVLEQPSNETQIIQDAKPSGSGKSINLDEGDAAESTEPEVLECKRKSRIRARKHQNEMDEKFKKPENPKDKFKPKVDKVSRGMKFASLTYGKMSQEAKHQMIQKFGTEPPDHSRLRMLDLIYFNPSKNPMTNKNKKCEITEEVETVKAKPEVSELVPRLKISENGEVCIEKESVILEREPIVENRDLIEEDGLFNKKRKITTNVERFKWSFEDTVKFYRALNMIGSDFEMIKTFFPNRSRKCIKAKFKREEKLHGHLIDRILGSCRVKYDINKLREELEVEADYKNLMAGKKDNLRKKCPRIHIKKWKGKGLQGDEGVDEILKNNKFYIDEDSETLDDPDNFVINQSSDEDSDTSVYSTDSECSTEKKRRLVKKSEYAKMLEDVLKDNITSDKLIFNTDIDMGDVKYTQSVIYNPHDLENPIDVNETIAHQEQSHILDEDCKN